MAKAEFTRAAFPNGSTATVTATIPGFGTPKAAIVFLRSGNAEEPNGTWIRSGIGLIAGTAQCSVGWSAQNGSNPSNSSRSYSGSFVCYKTAENGANHFATIGTLINDGIRFSSISWGDANSYYADILLIGGG